MTTLRVRKGQSLVEAVVAITIAILIITGLVTLAVSAVRSATLSRNRSLAVQSAQEGTEALRSIRDRAFSNLPTSGMHYIRWNGFQWEVSSNASDGVIGDIHTRSFIVSQIEAGKLRIDLSVSWTDTAGDHSVVLKTFLTDWQ